MEYIVDIIIRIHSLGGLLDGQIQREIGGHTRRDQQVHRTQIEVQESKKRGQGRPEEEGGRIPRDFLPQEGPYSIIVVGPWVLTLLYSSLKNDQKRGKIRVVVNSHKESRNQWRIA